MKKCTKGPQVGLIARWQLRDFEPPFLKLSSPMLSVSGAISFIDRRCESSRPSCLKQVHLALVISLPGSCGQNIQSHYMKHVHCLETAREKRLDWLKPGTPGSGELPGVDGVPPVLQPKGRKTAFPDVCALGSHTVGLNHCF